MPSNPTAHLVHLVHLLMATNQRMRSSFKILVALYRIFHTLFSSFFSGSSMAHHIYCSSFGASQALLLLSVHPSARLWGSVRAVLGLRHDDLVTLRAAFSSARRQGPAVLRQPAFLAARALASPRASSGLFLSPCGFAVSNSDFCSSRGVLASSAFSDKSRGCLK